MNRMPSKLGISWESYYVQHLATSIMYLYSYSTISWFIHVFTLLLYTSGLQRPLYLKFTQAVFIHTSLDLHQLRPLPAVTRLGPFLEVLL